MCSIHFLVGGRNEVGVGWGGAGGGGIGLEGVLLYFDKKRVSKCIYHGSKNCFLGCF